MWNKRDDGTPYPLQLKIRDYGLNSTSGYFVRNLFTQQDLGLFKPDDVLPLKVNPGGSAVMLKATLVAAGKGH